jgi:hypothetical protein
VQVGAIVAHGVYEGSVERIRERGEDDPLYCEVAEHQQLPFNAKTLWTYVRVYELLHRFPSLRECGLGLAHFRAVLGLPVELQERLLVRAGKDEWRSARLEEVAAQHRQAPASQGRPPTSAFLRTMRRIEQLAAGLEEDLGPRVRGRLATAGVSEARELLHRARRRLDSIEGQLGTLASLTSD